MPLDHLDDEHDRHDHENQNEDDPPDCRTRLLRIVVLGGLVEVHGAVDVGVEQRVVGQSHATQRR